MSKLFSLKFIANITVSLGLFSMVYFSRLFDEHVIYILSFLIIGVIFFLMYKNGYGLASRFIHDRFVSPKLKTKEEKKDLAWATISFFALTIAVVIGVIAKKFIYHE